MSSFAAEPFLWSCCFARSPTQPHRLRPISIRLPDWFARHETLRIPKISARPAASAAKALAVDPESFEAQRYQAMALLGQQDLNGALSRRFQTE